MQSTEGDLTAVQYIYNLPDVEPPTLYRHAIDIMAYITLNIHHPPHKVPPPGVSHTQLYPSATAQGFGERRAAPGVTQTIALITSTQLHSV